MLSTRERIVYLIAVIYTVTMVCLMFGKTISSRIFHHVYQSGPFKTAPSLILDIHAASALLILLLLTIMLIRPILGRNEGNLAKLAQRFLYFFCLPVFLGITILVFFRYIGASPFYVVAMVYFWGWIAIVYCLCLINFLNRSPLTQYNYILVLLLLFGSAANERFLRFFTLEVLNIDFSLGVILVMGILYLMGIFSLLFLALGDLRKHKFLLSGIIISSMVVLSLFFVLPTY